MTLLGILLLPLTFLYSLGVRLRNHLYNIGYSRSFKFEIPIILAGNLSAGGSGKTPMVEYLIRLLKDEFKLAILSRGYKRKTKGFYLASGAESNKTIGDEPMQYYSKWKSEITVALGEDRAEAIPKILFEVPQTEVILMDDGYQHRAVTPNFKILLSEYSNPFFKDHLLPSGRLREPRKEARRAETVVITKTPEGISNEKMLAVEKNVREYCRADVPVFFSTLKYSNPEPLFEWVPKADFKNVIIFSGIANPRPFENYVSTKWNILNAKHFPDHHEYNHSDIQTLKEIWKGYSSKSPTILTTEKDATKLTDPEISSLLQGLPIYVLKIKMAFIEAGSEFDSLIARAINV